MPRKLTLALTTTVCLAIGNVTQAQHIADRQGQIESLSALLDSHTRRLYYEVRKEAEGDADQSQFLSDTQELWHAARRLNDHAMDRVPAAKLERDSKRVEQAFESVEQQVSELRQPRETASSTYKRVKRIKDLLHDTHDRIHELSYQESSVRDLGWENSRNRADTTRSVNSGVHPGEAPRRAAEPQRVPVEYDNRPSIRVGPDGLHFDGRGITIPLGR